MADYLIIDAHVHTYQNREIGLQAKQGSTITDYAGTTDELLPIMEKARISRAVMVNMLPLAEMRDAALAKVPKELSGTERETVTREIDARMLSRLERRNTWTCDLATENPNLIPFINLDPLMDESTMTNEIVNRINNDGAKGIKLHPNSQQFFPNDHRLWPAYRTAERLGVPTIFHGGTFATAIQYAQPKHFEEVLSSFPSLILVMAHLGQGYPDEVRSLSSTYPNLCFDCSAIISHTNTAGSISETEFTDLIREVGIERIMFGSDFPWYDPADSAERLLKLDFGEKEKRMLLAENAIRIYKLS